MNSVRLLDVFDRISESAGSLSDIRRLFIRLAVTGRLLPHGGVSQPVDCAAVRAGMARFADKWPRCRWSPSAPISNTEPPLRLPPSWAWVRLNDLGLFVNGLAFKPADWRRAGIPIVRIQNLSDESKEFNYVEGDFPEENSVRHGDLLVSWSATLDAFMWRRQSGVLNQHIFKVLVNERAIEKAYLYWLLKNEIRTLAESDHAHGVAMMHINRGPFLGHLVPLPPLSEQRRIVAHLESLMSLCDQLETAQRGRELRRDQLVATSLDRLNESIASGDGESAQEYARFHLEHLPKLACRLGHVRLLRQAILNLAVRGKLVPQDSQEEPASKLLERVALDARAGRGRSARDRAEATSANDGRVAYAVPDSWAWSTAQDLVQPGQTITYGILKPVWVEQGVPTVRVTEMKTGTIRLEDLPRCAEDRAAKFAKTRLSEGDLLISKDGTIGKTAFVPPELAGGNITQHVLRFPISAHLERRFIRLCLDAPPCQAWMAGETKGVALQGVNVGDFRRMPIPVPPVEEQRRIVARIDELMGLCSELESKLAKTQADSRRLLSAVLGQALLPTS